MCPVTTMLHSRLSPLTALALAPLAATAAATAAEPVHGDLGLMVYAVGGTGGLGGGLGYHINDVVTLRAELAGFNYGDTASQDGISYRGDLKISTKAVYLDVHPFSGSFRLTVGLDSGRTKFGGTAVGNGGTVDVNGTAYTYGPSDWITAEVRYPSTLPYAGIGWGLNRSGFNLGFDLGVNVGHPDLSLARSPSLGLIPGFDEDFAAQRDKYAADVNGLRVYPIVKLSVGYSF